VRTADGKHEVVGVQLPCGYEAAIVAALRQQAPDLAALRAAAPNAELASGAAGAGAVTDDACANAELQQVMHACMHAPVRLHACQQAVSHPSV
jgi:hypothetical protein